MNAATHCIYEVVSRRPVTVEGALEERRRPFADPFCVKRPVSEGRMARPTPFETKRKKAPIGALGRIQYVNVAEWKGLQSNLLHALAHQNSALRFIKNLRDPEFPVSRRKIGYCVEPFAH